MRLSQHAHTRTHTHTHKHVHTGACAHHHALLPMTFAYPVAYPSCWSAGAQPSRAAAADTGGAPAGAHHAARAGRRGQGIRHTLGGASATDDCNWVRVCVPVACLQVLACASAYTLLARVCLCAAFITPPTHSSSAAHCRGLQLRRSLCMGTTSRTRGVHVKSV